MFIMNYTDKRTSNTAYYVLSLRQVLEMGFLTSEFVVHISCIFQGRKLIVIFVPLPMVSKVILVGYTFIKVKI